MKIAWLSHYPIYDVDAPVRHRKKSTHSVTWIVNLSKALREFFPELEIHIVTESQYVGSDFTFLRDGIIIHVIRSGSAIPLLLRGFPPHFPMDSITLYTLNRIRLIRTLNKINPDIVHAHGTESSYAISAIKSDYPCVITIQGILSNLIQQDFSLRYFIGQHLERYAVKKCHNFIANSPFARDFVLSINETANVFHIENPIHSSFFQIQRRYDIECKKVVFVGSLLRTKGVEELLQATALIKSIKVSIIGSGTPLYEKKLTAIATELKINDRINWLGYRTSEQIAEELQNAACLVLPSYMETNPTVISESMGAGVPVVASCVGGVPDLIKDGITGRLVPSKNVELLCKAILYYLEYPKHVIEDGLAAREDAMKRFTYEIAAKKTHDAYLAIAKGKTNVKTQNERGS